MWKNFKINDEVFIIKKSELLNSKNCSFLTGKVIKKGSKFLTVLIEGIEVKFDSKIIYFGGFCGYSYQLFKSEEDYLESISLMKRKEQLIIDLDNFSKLQLTDILDFVDMYINTSN